MTCNKSKLNELCLARWHTPPKYNTSISDATNEDHAPFFDTVLTLPDGHSWDVVAVQGKARDAEEVAAGIALKQLQISDQHSADNLLRFPAQSRGRNYKSQAATAEDVSVSTDDSSSSDGAAGGRQSRATQQFTRRAMVSKINKNGVKATPVGTSGMVTLSGDIAKGLRLGDVILILHEKIK